MAKIPNEKKKKKNIRLLRAIADVSGRSALSYSLKEKRKEAEIVAFEA